MRPSRLRFAFLASTICLVNACKAYKHPPRYGDSFVGVGFLPGTDSSTAGDVSRDGDTVVGTTTLSTNPGWDGEAFVWERSTGIHGLDPLPTIPGSAIQLSSQAYAISSDAWLAVGDSRYEVPDAPGSLQHEAVRWLSYAARRFTEPVKLPPGGRKGVGGSPDPLGFLSGGVRSSAFCVSGKGAMVVGFSTATVDSQGIELPFVWRDPKANGNGVMTPLDLGGAVVVASRAESISDDGDVIVGWLQLTSGGFYRPCLWRRTEFSFAFSPLPDPPGADHGAWATAVSGDGTVVVGGRRDASGAQQTCRWQWNGTSGGWSCILLGTLPGDSSSYPGGLPCRAVSFDGVVAVGISSDGTRETPFVWDAKNGMRKLADVLTAAGITSHLHWDLAEAMSVSGDATYGYTIVGQGTDPTNQMEAWVAHLDAKWF